MRIIESALFRLCLRQAITLEQAKIIRALYDGMACPITGLQDETGLSEEDLWISLRGLECKGIVSESGGIYFLDDFEKKLPELIDSCEKQPAPANGGRKNYPFATANAGQRGYLIAAAIPVFLIPLLLLLFPASLALEGKHVQFPAAPGIEGAEILDGAIRGIWQYRISFGQESVLGVDLQKHGRIIQT